MIVKAICEFLKGFTIYIICSVIGIIAYGYTFSLLWKWFIVPIFHLPELSIVYSIGIITILAFLSGNGEKEGEGGGEGSQGTAGD